MPDQATWEFINTFAPWLAGIGTLIVASVALYLALTERRIHLGVNAGLRIMTQRTGRPEDREECILLSAINRRFRNARVIWFYWRSGFFRKERMIQLPLSANDPYSTELPADLVDGATACQYIPALLFAKDIHKFFPSKFAEKHPSRYAKTIHIGVMTSIGARFEQKIEQPLRQFILNKYLEQRKQSNPSG